LVNGPKHFNASQTKPEYLWTFYCSKHLLPNDQFSITPVDELSIWHSYIDEFHLVGCNVSGYSQASRTVTRTILPSCLHQDASAFKT